MSRLLFWTFETAEEEAAEVSASKYTRMLAALLPPGRVWRLIGDSFLSRVLAACADEIGRLDQRGLDLLEEADPRTTSELLAEYESELALDPEGTFEERRARMVARVVARQRYRPVDFQNSLAVLLGLAAEDVEVIETTHTVADSMGDVREIFRFFIYRDPTLPGSYFLASAQALVDLIKPSHTAGHVIESVDFLCDDEFSLCDRDLLGV